MEIHYDVKRIEKLRADALSCVISYEEFYYLFHKRFVTTYGRATYASRYADAYEYALENAAVSIDECELIVGKTASRQFTDDERTEWNELRKYSVAAHASPFGQDSHMAIDYDLLVKRGIKGIIADINTYKSKLSDMVVDDFEKLDFYDCCIRCLNAVVKFSNRYADAAELMAQSASADRAAELMKISTNCRNVPYNPACTFYEAVQSVQFVTFCVSLKPLRAGGILQYQLGRPDRYLADSYYADIKSGAITKYEAQTLLDCLGVLINRRVPRGLSSGYMVGGRDINGEITKGELTQMCMRVVSDNRLVYPSVGLCVADGGDDQREDIEVACRILGAGCSHPAFFNDDVIQQGLRNYGLPPEDACSYIHSTCVEITPIAASNVWVASPYINLLQTLLDVLDREYNSKDELMEVYFANLSNRIHGGYLHEIRNRTERRRYDMDPLLSCFVNNCLRDGVDIEHGGAKYNWIMPSFVGLSNAADSINAINDLIFDKKLYTFKQLKEMLDNNFADYENDRQIFSRRVEKYGNDNDEIDAIVKTITEYIPECCKKYEGLIIPSLFCWIMHDIFGRDTGASPDGRLAGFPLGDGSGPAQGREHNGPTASILSSTKWDHTPFIGGIAVNMKFSKSYMREESYDVMMALIKSYITRGGFELQINVTDAELLKKAQKQPELYRDLVVRIGGYSDYFVSLSPTMQEEVITRTVHCI